MCLSGLNLDEICGLDEREIFLAVAAWSEVPGCPGLRLGLIGFFTCFFLVFYESSHQNTTNRFFSGNPGKGSIFYHSMCFRCSKKILKEVFHGIPPCSYLFVDSLWFSVRVCVCFILLVAQVNILDATPKQPSKMLTSTKILQNLG